jgi:hypothetical protein
MRDDWYGDKRDPVKWAALIHLARSLEIAHILYVACYRQSNAGGLVLKMSRGQDAVRRVLFADEVWRHFRDIHHIAELETTTGLRIEVFDKEPADGGEYYRAVEREVIRRRGERLLVFLDPDTGLAPRTRSLKHVDNDKVGRIYAALGAGGALVLYQHARRKQTWRVEVTADFAQALGLPDDQCTFECPEIAPDVASLAATNPSGGTLSFVPDV